MSGPAAQLMWDHDCGCVPVCSGDGVMPTRGLLERGRAGDARIRRLPVLDGQGALLGILSLADLAREAVREQTRAHREVTEVEVNDTLAAICQPSGQSLPA